MLIGQVLITFPVPSLLVLPAPSAGYNLLIHLRACYPELSTPSAGLQPDPIHNYYGTATALRGTYLWSDAWE